MKKVRIIFIAFFIVLLLVPAVTMPLTKNAANTENRNLATFPKFVEEGKINTDFSDGLDTYLKDHIGLRSTLVNANQKVMSTVFGESSVDNVIIGKDGWLYYGNTVNDFVNVPTISERNLNNVATTYKLVQDYVEKQGAKFVFVAVPNKNTLYGDNMPYNYVVTKDKGNYELVNEALSAKGVKTVDLYDTFKQNPEVLYQKTDSHWNYKGALLGYNTILDAAVIDHNAFAGVNFTEREDWDGDLGVMLYSTNAKKEKQLYPDEGTFHYIITSHETAVDAITLETHNDEGSGNAVIYRDSFFNTAQVFFAENFENTTFSRAVPYKIDLTSEMDADVVILEIVERNLANLVAKAPMMKAPAVSIDAKVNVVDGSKFTIKSEENGQYTHYFGTVSESLLGREYKVYIMGKAGDEYSSFEAFPIYETELLGSKVTGDNGFSGYIPTELANKFDSITVMVYSNGAYYIAD